MTTRSLPLPTESGMIFAARDGLFIQPLPGPRGADGSLVVDFDQRAPTRLAGGRGLGAS